VVVSVLQSATPNPTDSITKADKSRSFFECLQFNSPHRKNVLEGSELFDDLVRYRAVGSQEYHILLFLLFLAHLHSTDVYPMLPKGARNTADNTWRIQVVYQEVVPLGYRLEIEVIDTNNPRQVIPEYCPPIVLS